MERVLKFNLIYYVVVVGFCYGIVNFFLGD